MNNSLNIDLKDIASLPLKQQLCVIGFFCIALMAIGYYYSISSIKKNLVAAQKQEVDLKDQFQSLQTMQSAIADDVALYPQIAAAIKAWNSKLVQPTAVSDLTNDILKLGMTNNLQFEAFSPGPEVKVDQYLEIPIRVVVSGQYNDIAAFMSQIANMDTIVSIADFSLSKNIVPNPEAASKGNNASNVSNRLSAELNLEVYHVAAK